MLLYWGSLGGLSVLSLRQPQMRSIPCLLLHGDIGLHLRGQASSNLRGSASSTTNGLRQPLAVPQGLYSQD